MSREQKPDRGLTSGVDEPDEYAATAVVVVEHVVSSVGASFGSVSMWRGRDERYETVGATDDRARAADEVQYAAGEGPCLSAHVGNDDLVRSDDVATDERWPTFGAQAAAAGVTSALSVKLRHHRGTVLGSLNLYRDRLAMFADDAARLALALAAQAATVLAILEDQVGLRQAVVNRTRIGQAQGIVMERYGLTSEQAFAVLRRHSQDHNTKVSEVATRLVETGDLPGAARP